MIDKWKTDLTPRLRQHLLLLFNLGPQLLHVGLELGQLLRLAVHFLPAHSVVHDLEDLLHLAQVVPQRPWVAQELLLQPTHRKMLQGALACRVVVDPQWAVPTHAPIHERRRSTKSVRRHHQLVVVEVERLGFDVQVVVVVVEAERLAVLQLLPQLGDGSVGGRGGGGGRGGARLHVAAHPAVDGDQSDALLAAYVGAVGAGVGEALLAVGALIGFFT